MGLVIVIASQDIKKSFRPADLSEYGRRFRYAALLNNEIDAVKKNI